MGNFVFHDNVLFSVANFCSFDDKCNLHMFNLDSDHCPDFCLTLHKSRMVVDHQGIHQVAYILVCDINRDGSLFNLIQ